MSYFYGFRAEGHAWRRSAPTTGSTAARSSTTPTNAPTAKWIALGSIEPQFYALLREKAGLSDPAFDAQMDRDALAGAEGKGRARHRDARRGRNGARSWKAPTSASRRCSRSARRRLIRTTWRATSSSRSTASCSRRRRRVSARRRARCRVRRLRSARTMSSALRDWGIGAARIDDLQRKGVI